MPLGPVFRHEMLAAGRKRRYFFFRSLVGVGMLLLLAAGYAAARSFLQIDGALRGQGGGDVLSISGLAYLTAFFYAQFAWATMIGVLVATPAVVAGAIAMERERRTIEYLFATDLRNSEIVLDKLVARLLTVGKLVLATLPVLAIFRLLGGVPGRLLLAHFAMLASTATLTAAVSLAVGVWCERARDAVPRALGVVFLWLIALPLAMLFQAQLDRVGEGWSDTLSDWVFTPAVAALGITHPLLVLATSAGVGGGVLGIDVDGAVVATMIGAQLVAAGLLVALSVAVVRRVHLRALSSPGARPKAPDSPAASRSPYESRPMLWKELFAASAKKRGVLWARRVGAALLALTVGGPLVAMLVANGLGSWSVDIEEYMATAVAMVSVCGSVLALSAGSRAAGLVTYERERDTWVSLLTTPLTGTDVIAAKTWGNLYAYRWPAAGVVLVPLMGVFLSPAAALAALGVAVALGVLLLAGTSVGLAISLRMENSVKAAGATVCVLLAIGLFLPMVAMALVGLSGQVGVDMALVFAPLAPFLLAVPAIAITEHTPAEIGGAYFLGIAFYAGLGCILAAMNCGSFDRVCGRGAEDDPPHQRLASQVASAS